VWGTLVIFTEVRTWTALPTLYSFCPLLLNLQAWNPSMTFCFHIHHKLRCDASVIKIKPVSVIKQWRTQFTAASLIRPTATAPATDEPLLLHGLALDSCRIFSPLHLSARLQTPLFGSVLEIFSTNCREVWKKEVFSPFWSHTRWQGGPNQQSNITVNRERRWDEN
jgi:hypothetical protein